MKDEREPLNSAERTREFFEQDVEDLAIALQGRVVALYGTNRRIRIDEAIPFRREDVGQAWKRRKGENITNLPVGSLWAFKLPLRGMRQSLVTAKELGEQGACVRIRRASRFDPEAHIFVPMQREGDIANFFELDDYAATALKFLNPSDTLYIRTGKGREVDPEKAKEYFQRLLGE